MTNLSPAARAVLEAVTWKKYDVPPEGLPAFAEEMAPLIAVALRASADQAAPESCFESDDVIRAELLAIAAELDGIIDLEPNDLSDLSEEEFESLAPQGYHAP